jgi:exosortase
VLLVITLGARAFFHDRGNQWGEVVTLLPVLACLVLGLYGRPGLSRAWPAVAYLAFMIPLPARIDSMLALPLQRLATVASCVLLKLTGLWVIAEGNVIHVDADRLEVATACNGLSMMVSLAATVTALVLLLPLRPWRQVVLLLSIVPVALASNVLRISATAWCYHRFGAAAGERFAHDAAGWLMMPVALVLVGLEAAALGWMFRDEEVEVQPMLLGRPIAPGGSRGRAKQP